MNPYAGRHAETETVPARRRGDLFPYTEPAPAGLMPVITPEMVAESNNTRALAEAPTGPIPVMRPTNVMPQRSLRRMPPHITAALCSLRPELEKIATRHEALLEDIDRVTHRLELLETDLRREGYLA